eukprot:2646051-Pleurochrysis_carterae.AAC.1
MISDIIPEWRVMDNKKKKGIIALLRSWTGEMMNSARIQMNTWVTIKNEHKASVQRRWDNRGKCIKHSGNGGEGYGMNTMHRRREKRMGKEE